MRALTNMTRPLADSSAGVGGAPDLAPDAEGVAA